VSRKRQSLTDAELLWEQQADAAAAAAAAAADVATDGLFRRLIAEMGLTPIV